jgi:radical SAM superfamily enzyme YgiQ (UPF0313 family)
MIRKNKKEINKFMFVIPNTRWFGKRGWLWFTPAVALLLPILKKYGVKIEVLEANIDNLTLEQAKDRIKLYQPDVVGITNLSLEYWKQAHISAKLVKEVDPNIITVMGGVHPTTLPHKVMEDSNIDYVVLSEGEKRLPMFLDIIQSMDPDFSKMDGIGYRENEEVIINEPIGWINDLDSLPLPDYSLFDWKKISNFQQSLAGGVSTKRAPAGAVLTSRGCPFRCCFCSSKITMGNKPRLRSTENVLREVDMLVRDYGIKELVFTDDEMYATRERAAEIIEGIKQRNYDLIWKNINIASWKMDYELMKSMKEGGCYQITISPESGSKRVLKEIIHKPVSNMDYSRKIAKWCKDLDIELQADFVIGFPGETWEEIRQTTNFAEELDADSVKFAVATPFPGTELFRKAVEKGYLPEDFEFYREDALGFAKSVIETEEFSKTELQMIRCLEWDRINFKTEVKKERYARVNILTLKELEEFRRETRRNIGIYFMGQSEGEREGIDMVTKRDESVGSNFL